MEFQKICANKKEVCLCERRSNIPVEDKYQMDPIWILWEIIINYANSSNNKMKVKLISYSKPSDELIQSDILSIKDLISLKIKPRS